MSDAQRIAMTAVRAYYPSAVVVQCPGCCQPVVFLDPVHQPECGMPLLGTIESVWSDLADHLAVGARFGREDPCQRLSPARGKW